ncbi:hypothetical protein OG735_01200 [Streptomyces sp. NBC_01210]|nr:hypothetical protein OG735_01200 [Streptomyces sp. NBC_01210]
MFAALVFAAPLATVPANAAGVDQLNGYWSPFTRCPVDNRVMLAADGKADIASCVSSYSPSGTIKLGNLTALTSASELQFGVVQHAAARTFTVVPPPGGAVVGAPTEIPGGLLGLVCTSGIPVVSDICRAASENGLNRVTATVESVGTPTDFSLTSALGPGMPIVRLPVRIRLQNPLLSSECYIGSADDPIVLRLQNDSKPAMASQRFDGDGTPNASRGAMMRFVLTESSQGDSGFAVPKAHDCGLWGLVDLAIDLKVGLPSPAGNNSLVLSGASIYSAGLTAPGIVHPDNGKHLSKFWHSALLP